MSLTQSSISCVPFKWCANETIVANKISFSNMTGFGSSCGACKFLRRKCTGECVFAPYFSYDQASNHFAAVHKVFGASNVSKLLLNLPVQNRGEAAISVSYEAIARMKDPIYGCVGHIFALQQQVASLQEEVDFLGSQMDKVAFDVPTYGISQSADTNPINGLQFALQCNDISINDYLVLDQGNPSLSGSGSTTESHTFYNQTQEQFPLPYGLENQVSCSYSNSNFTERLYEGKDEESFLNLPWMDSGCNTLNMNSVDASTFR